MTPSDYAFLRRFLKDQSGLELSSDKQYLVESRLIPLARRLGLRDIAELVARLKAGSEPLMPEVVEAMTTNETFFFRDKTPFDQLSETIFPALLRARADRRALRIWCAASSTGQEPYSIAMCVKEFAGLSGWRVDIVATDLSRAVLEKSSAGLFSQFEVQRGLPIRMLVKYFTPAGDSWRLNGDIRAMVAHRQLNLLHDFSHLGRFDVIFCRNVLIYCSPETKAGIFNRLAGVIEPDGVLALGAAESVVGITEAFRPDPDQRGLYRPAAVRSVRPALSTTTPALKRVASAR